MAAFTYRSFPVCTFQRNLSKAWRQGRGLLEFSSAGLDASLCVCLGTLIGCYWEVLFGQFQGLLNRYFGLCKHLVKVLPPHSERGESSGAMLAALLSSAERRSIPGVYQKA